jgi:hypothetical protein
VRQYPWAGTRLASSEANAIQLTNSDHQMTKPNKRMASETKKLQNLLNKHACFRYPIDGQTEFDRAFREALDKVFVPKPNSAYNCWVRKLRQNGLIP